MKKRKPRHKDRHLIPPANTVPRDYDCTCDCHDGVTKFEFMPCCKHCGKVRADWPDGADRSAL